MGLAAWITNACDGKTYIVSTVKNPLNGVWGSAVFEQGRLPFLHGKMLTGVCPITLEAMAKAGLAVFEVEYARILGTNVIKGKPLMFFPVVSISEREMAMIHSKVATVIEESPQYEWRRLLESMMLEYLASDDQRSLVATHDGRRARKPCDDAGYGYAAPGTVPPVGTALTLEHGQGRGTTVSEYEPRRIED